MVGINRLDKKTILKDEIFAAIFEEKDEVQRARLIISLEDKAGELGVKLQFRTLIKAYSKSLKEKEKAEAEAAAQQKTQILESTGRTSFKGPYPDLCCVGWMADEYGVFKNSRGDKGDMLACYHPILPIARIKNIETGEEQLRIAFKRGGKWQELNASKLVTSSAARIISLATQGISVTSENAKNLVRYLADVENLNDNLVKIKESTTKLGWNKGTFLPYDSEILFDGETKFKQITEAIHEKGEFQEWLNCIKDIRRTAPLEIQVMLAASFASVLVKPLSALPFFVDLWGETESGKSVALMMAASVWGNPDENTYIKDYKGTEVGLEAICNVLNNLPLLLDDSSNKNRRLEDNFESLIYDLCSGKGKTRSNKELGLSRECTWKNCIITNGERPLSGYVTQGGAMNRILEIHAGHKLLDNPTKVCKTIKENYGFAGKMFVEYVKRVGISSIKEVQERYLRLISTKEHMAKQALSLSVILTADRIATDLIFKDKIYIDIEDVLQILTGYDEVSEVKRCYQYLIDKIVMNPGHFSGDDRLEQWGDISNGYARFYPAALQKLCQDGKYNHKAFLQWAKETNLLLVDKGQSLYKTIKKFGKCYKTFTFKIESLQDGEVKNEDGFANVCSDDCLPFV